MNGLSIIENATVREIMSSISPKDILSTPNCKNCGAALNQKTCAYCGTYYPGLPIELTPKRSPAAFKPYYDYTVVPEGVYHAVCVDVVDIGLTSTKYGYKPMLKVVFQLDHTISDRLHPSYGKRYIISKRFHSTLHPMSALSRFIGQWRVGSDTEKWIGKNGVLRIVHQIPINDMSIATIESINPCENIMKPLNYVRIYERLDFK